MYGYWLMASFATANASIHHDTYAIMMLWHLGASNDVDMIPIIYTGYTLKSCKQSLIEGLFCFSWCWQIHCDTDISNNTITPTAWCQKWWQGNVNHPYRSHIKLDKRLPVDSHLFELTLAIVLPPQNQCHQWWQCHTNVYTGHIPKSAKQLSVDSLLFSAIASNYTLIPILVNYALVSTITPMCFEWMLSSFSWCQW